MVNFITLYLEHPEAVTLMCSVKKWFLKISQNSWGNTCARDYFSIKLQAPDSLFSQSCKRATLLKKSLWHRCFPVNFAKFLRTPEITEHLLPEHPRLLFTTPIRLWWCNVWSNLQQYLSSKNEFNWIQSSLAITGIIKGTAREKLHLELRFESLHHRCWYRKSCCFLRLLKSKIKLPLQHNSLTIQ